MEFFQHLQTALGATYRLDRELARGGMSRLFLATDTALNRKVVIKVLPPELTSEVSAGRFKQEMELAARLQHPHILPVLTAGARDDLLYYVMPYVAGESLRHRLQASGKLPVTEAVRILDEVADALAYAHTEGVVHRDVKPENILLQHGHAVLADFGVARALFEASSGGRFTATGMAIGTPGYMAPEQVGREPVIDGRADIYALAVVGYEMLAGAPPFVKPGAQALLAATLTESPAPLSELRRDVPGEVCSAIGKALAKAPADRFGSAAEFADGLAGTAEAPRRSQQYVRAAGLDELGATGCLSRQVEGHTLALFRVDDRVYAVDNRCPHMGFPLHRGTLRDGILTCHWHHARFDLASGGTFDQWADDVRTYPVEIRGDEVWVDLAPLWDPRTHQRQRLSAGLERNIPLVIAKAAITLLQGGGDPRVAFRIGLEFGARYRQAGWGQGLTVLTCMMNLLPHLDDVDRPHALYHGLSAVAWDCHGAPPRFQVEPLPTSTADIGTLKHWFRAFVEVRDAEGAERCVASAIRAGADHRDMADMLLAAVTDHRYIRGGHALDFTNKAFEALDVAGWDTAEAVLTSLVGGYATAERMEEANSWRHPVDLVAILERAFEALPAAVEAGRSRLRTPAIPQHVLVGVLLGDDPEPIVDALLIALREGASGEELAATVAYAAALRIARFHASNEFTDWDTALHTFTFANAVHQGMRRAPSPELLRGVFDGAMSVYLDRYLNIPAARLPEPEGVFEEPGALLRELPSLLDRQQQVEQAGGLIARYLFSGGAPNGLLAALGDTLLREDRDFHTIQAVEAAVRQYELLGSTPAGAHVLVAAARYLAAHAPTVRAEGQTFQIARRLSRGERLFEAQ